jgi:hypothetical protein
MDVSEEYVASIFRVEEYLLYAGLLLHLLFESEDGRDIFHRNVG